MRELPLPCLAVVAAFLAGCSASPGTRDGGSSSGGTGSSSGATTGSSSSGTGSTGGTTGSGSTSGGTSGGNFPLGAACGAGQCASGLTCLTQVPGGYCTAACSGPSSCPAGAACVEVLPGQFACGLSCQSDGDCARGGFACDPSCKVCIPAIAVGQISCGAGPVGQGGRSPDGGVCGALPGDGGIASFGAEVNVSAGPQTQSEAEGVLAASDAGTLVAAFMVVPSDGGLSAPANWIGTAVSTDDGTSFTVESPIVDAPDQIAFDPSLAIDPSGRYYLAYAGAVVQGPAVATGHLWVQTSQDAVAWGAPVNALSPGDVDPDGGAIDKPVLAISPASGLPYAAFGEFSGTFGGPGPYQIRLVAGASGAASFRPGVEIDNGGRPAFRDLPALSIDNAGFIYLAWVESTNLTEVVEDQASGSNLAGGTDCSIWFAALLPSQDGSVSSPQSANVQVSAPADRVVVDRPVLLATPDGASLYAVYVVGDQNATDVVVATSQDTGADWSAPVHVNADVGCATHFHPAASLDAQGRLWVTWTDNRDGQGHVFYAVSTDGAQTFTPAALVSATPFAFDTLDGIPAWLGGYQTLLGSGAELYSVFTAPVGGTGIQTDGHVYLAKALLP